MQRSLASQSNNFDDIDKEQAYAVWIIEKEFATGWIDSEFPAMKFFNLIDEYNLKRYKQEQDSQSGRGGSISTF